MTVNVLGTKYKIIVDDNLKSEGADGVCQIYNKEIHIAKPAAMLESDANETEKYRRHCEVLRHEILHAFLHESGMDNMNQEDEEKLVYWLAREFPNMVKTFKSIGCLGVEE